jgi:hypothetical protein
MVLYATVIPFNSIETERYDLSQEILKILINTVELVLINYSLKTKHYFSETEVGLKVLTVGLSWVLADSIGSYLLYFLMNATGEEFKWEYIQTAIQSNFDLIDRIALVALVECFDKLRNDKKWNIHIVLILIFKYFFNGLGFKYIDRLRSEDPWNQLVIKGTCTLVFAIFSRIIFSYVFVDEDTKANEAYELHKMKGKRD